MDNTIDYIVDWLKSYANQAGSDGFVIGISGGIDSAVTSKLCARTGLKVIALNLPISNLILYRGCSIVLLQIVQKT